MSREKILIVASFLALVMCEILWGGHNLIFGRVLAYGSILCALYLKSR